MPKQETIESRLNPKIREMEIGIRSFRKISLYPMSVGDQLTLSGLVSQVMSLPVGEGGNIQFVEGLIGVIEKNLEKILELAAGEKNLLSEMDNDQFVEAMGNIFEVNYENALKNGIDLTRRVRVLFPSKKLSPASADITPATPSNPSTEDLIKTGELHFSS